MIHRYVERDRRQSLSEEILYGVLRSPIVTEKSTIQQEKNQYFFWVAHWANKFSIKKAVEAIFQVQVHSVNTSCLKGKQRRFRGRLGVQSDKKKAIVTLKSGQTLDLGTGGQG